MYRWINTETGQCHKNIWDLTGFLLWYFFYNLRHGFKYRYPGKWKYNKKGW